MAVWLVVMPITQNNRQMALTENSSDPTKIDLNLLDSNDQILGGITLTGEELTAMGTLTGQALAVRNLAGL